MHIKYFIPVLLILLSAILLSACDVVGASASTSLGGVTPMDTSARTPLVAIGITEDQDATDGANSVITGGASSSDLGVYHGPATSSLTGAGTILLQRTCSWTLHGPFDTIRLTYQSTASVAVTWSH